MYDILHSIYLLMFYFVLQQVKGSKDDKKTTPKVLLYV